MLISGPDSTSLLVFRHAQAALLAQNASNPENAIDVKNAGAENTRDADPANAVPDGSAFDFGGYSRTSATPQRQS